VSQTRRRWKTGLIFVGLAGIIVSLARPRWGSEVHVTGQRGVQIMVVLDVSASMLAEDVKPNRLTRAKLTIEEMIKQLGGNELGLVLFSGAAFVQFPLTGDLNTALLYLAAADTQAISRPGTALEAAIRMALDSFPEQIISNRVILLLTDGEGHEGDPFAAATLAKKEGVIIHAVGFGSPDGEPIPLRDTNGALLDYKKDAQGETVLSRLDETTLSQMAERTGGLYFRASVSGREIDAISNAIAALDTSEFESQLQTQRADRFEWFAALALLALTAEAMIGDRKKIEP
jgi:Ca-activated chloride channel family protein